MLVISLLQLPPGDTNGVTTMDIEGEELWARNVLGPRIGQAAVYEACLADPVEVQRPLKFPRLSLPAISFRPLISFPFPSNNSLPVSQAAVATSSETILLVLGAVAAPIPLPPTIPSQLLKPHSKLAKASSALPPPH